MKKSAKPKAQSKKPRVIKTTVRKLDAKEAAQAAGGYCHARPTGC